MATWTQAICGRCYERREPGKQPYRMKEEYAEVERCCDCGEETREGIYFRVHPSEVRFPREEKA